MVIDGYNVQNNFELQLYLIVISLKNSNYFLFECKGTSKI